jgi:hypothetical protein
LMEALDFLLLEFFFGSSPDVAIAGLVELDHVPEDAGSLEAREPQRGDIRKAQGRALGSPNRK